MGHPAQPVRDKSEHHSKLLANLRVPAFIDFLRLRSTRKKYIAATVLPSSTALSLNISHSARSPRYNLGRSFCI